MYREGLLKDTDIYANLPELISGIKRGREHDDEFIYFNSVGLSYIDIEFANYIYQEAKQKNMGNEFVLAETDTVDYKYYI